MDLRQQLAQERLQCGVRNPDPHRRPRKMAVIVPVGPRLGTLPAFLTPMRLRDFVINHTTIARRQIKDFDQEVKQANGFIFAKLQAVREEFMCREPSPKPRKISGTVDLCPYDKNEVSGNKILINGRTVTVGSYITEGSFRRVYRCDHKDGSPRKYLLKRAKCTDGKEDNLAEQWLYDNALNTSYMCRFGGVSEDGEWLLVEECTTARSIGNESNIMHSVMLAAEKSFPDELQWDLRPANWGVTNYDKRVVKFDIAPYGRGVQQIAKFLGVPAKDIKAYSRRTKDARNN